MKKASILLTAAVLSFSLAACQLPQDAAETQTTAATEPAYAGPQSMAGIDPGITEKDGVHIPSIRELYDSREPEQSMTIVPGSMVPQGCAYFIYAENPEEIVRLEPGDLFPEKSKNGDVFKSPYFKYTYDSNIVLQKNPSIIDANSSSIVPETVSKRTGWKISCHFNDEDRSIYYHDVIGDDIAFEDALEQGLFPEDMFFKSCDEPMFGKINGWDVLSAKELYVNNLIMEHAPDFADEILDISGAFIGCLSLKEIPRLPESAENMDLTFHMCNALEEGPVIPKKVFTMNGTFYNCISLRVPSVLPNDGALIIMLDTFHGCTALETFPEIPSTVISMDGCFEDCAMASGDLIVHCDETALQANKSYVNAFDGCSLENITLKGDSPFIAEIHREFPEMQKGY